MPFLPMNEVVLSGSLGLFAKVSTIVTGGLSVVFMMRLCFLVVKVSPAEEYGDLIQDCVYFLGVTAIYPVLLKLIVFGLGDLAQKISFIPIESSQQVLRDFFDRMFSDLPIFMVFGKVGDLFILGIANSIYSALLSLLIASGPIFILLGTMLNLQTGIKSYFGLIICLNLWPVMWNLLGQLSIQMGGLFHESPVTSVCFVFVVQVLQLLSPIFSFTLFKSLSLDSGAGKLMSVGRMMWR